MAQATQEILGKLGIDVSQVPKDLTQANDFFKKFSKEVEATGTKTGSSFGGQFTDQLGKKLGGAGGLATAVAAALGINVTKIADSIASAIVGGSKEGWEEAGRIADENGKLIAENFRKNLSPKQLADDLAKELKNAQKELLAIKPDKKLITFGDDSEAREVDGEWTAELSVKRENALKKVLEIEGKIADLKKVDRDAEKDLNAARASDEAKHLEGQSKISALSKEISDTMTKIVQGGLTDAEIAKLKIQLIEKEGQIRDENFQISKKENDLQNEQYKDWKQHNKEYEEAVKKKADLERQARDQQSKVDEDKAKIADRSKLTISELANLKAGDPKKEKSGLDLSFGADAGLTQDQIALKKRAQEAEDQAAEVERLRLAGRTGEAGEAMTKLDQMRSELVGSGLVKSSEDPQKQLIEQLRSDTETLNKTQIEIRDVLKGKFVNS